MSEATVAKEPWISREMHVHSTLVGAYGRYFWVSTVDFGRHPDLEGVQMVAAIDTMLGNQSGRYETMVFHWGDDSEEEDAKDRIEPIGWTDLWSRKTNDPDEVEAQHQAGVEWAESALARKM